MRLFIESEGDGIVVIEAMTVEWDNDADVITIFDFNDNKGVIKMESAYAASRVIRNMSSSTNVIKIEGKFDWQ